MDNLANFVSANIENIFCVFIFVVLVVVLLRLRQKRMVAQVILGLVVRAEKALGSGTGELKYALVITWVYEKLPSIIRVLFTRKEIDLMIEDGVKTLKRYLENEIKLTGYDDEVYMEKLESEREDSEES